MIIDMYAHHISRRVGQMLLKGKYYGPGREFPFPQEQADADVRLALMEKYNVDAQVISQTAPVLLGLNAAEAAEVCSYSNDDNYTLCKDYPGKFYNVCILSLLDVKGAVEELKRCINELDCRGITLATSQNEKGLDAEEFYPVWELCTEHDLPILLHGTHFPSTPLMDMENAWRFMHVFGWDFDNTMAIWRMIFGGTIDRFPTIKLVTHHLGNYFPFFKRRIEQNVKGFLADQIPRPIQDYYQNMYGDTAVDGTVGAFPCGYAFFGAERMLYGSDYPFGGEAGEDFIRENLKCVQGMCIPDAEKAQILGLNSKKMFKID